MSRRLHQLHIKDFNNVIQMIISILAHVFLSNIQNDDNVEG